MPLLSSLYSGERGPERRNTTQQACASHKRGVRVRTQRVRLLLPRTPVLQKRTPQLVDSLICSQLLVLAFLSSQHIFTGHPLGAGYWARS